LSPSSKSPADWLKWLVFELGAGYYARKLATGPEAELRREFMDFLACAPGERVLDVGCGPGHMARQLAQRGCRVTGVDRGWRLLKIARRWAAKEGVAVEFRRAPGEQLPFANGSFDCTFATTVIYWVERPEAVLREMARVTRLGGSVATLDPHASMSVASMREFCSAQNLDSQGTRKLLAWARAAELSRRFTEEDLRCLLDSAGLASLQLNRRLGGLVWFARGAVTAKAAG
jgi:ubiquinone/menaquinone biosynthesis C-methylase UbiE